MVGLVASLNYKIYCIKYIFAMSKDEEDKFLKFGQGIRIEGFKTEGEVKGFLTAQGFADIKSKYETYDD